MSEYAFVYQPQIIRETAEGLNRLDIRDEMLDQRELELMTSVDAESCAVVIRGLLHLQRQDPTMPITLYINSPGGEVRVRPGALRRHASRELPIRTVCLGMAASMGALLFIAGDEREILPHSRIMIHDPLIGAGAGRQRAFRESPGRRPHAHPRHHGRRHRAAQRHVDRARLRAYGIRHLFRSGGSR